MSWALKMRAAAPAPPRFVCAARSHTGGRHLNEDRVLARPELGLWAVADGMGGHDAGDVASGLVVETLGAVASCGSGYALVKDVTARLEDANRRLLARRGPFGQSVMGSTVVVLLAYEAHYACLWAGDSRAYLLRDGGLSRISHDHSVVQEMVDAGLLSPEQARTHPRANIITRAVGVSKPLELERTHAPIRPGDAFLLCSDGLTATVSDEEIAVELAGEDPDAVAEALLALSLRRGARDNVSLVVVKTDLGQPI